MNESLSQVLVALASASAAFFAAGIGLVAAFRGAGASRAPLVRSGLALLVPSLLAVLANVAAAGGVVPWGLPAGLAALAAAACAVLWIREREGRSALLAAGIVLAALSAAAALALGRGLVA